MVKKQRSPSKAYQSQLAVYRKPGYCCSDCAIPIHLTPDWVMWPWADSRWLCTRCNDDAIDRGEDPDAG